MSRTAHHRHSIVDVPCAMSGESLLLPKAARGLLIAAGNSHPAERRKKVDAAIDTVKMLYPDYFHHEETEGVEP